MGWARVGVVGEGVELGCIMVGGLDGVGVMR